MKIKFCGAARYVTGSCHLVTLDSGLKILLDCGLFQGRGKNIWEKNNNWLFEPSEIDILILSHAHIDHTGRVPKLVKDGFRGRIISTHATRSLCAIMLLDSAYIQERDVEYYNRKLLKKRTKNKWKNIREPLYTKEHVEKTMDLFMTFAYDSWTTVHPDVKVIFKDAGHILGSSSVTLKIEEGGKTRTLAFTGDIGRPNRPILKDPRQMPEADIVIAESTYGDKLHEGHPAQLSKFLSVVNNTCVKKGGKLIIPAFSVGRTQEIVYMLDQLESSGQLPKIPVYVDSPLAVNATEVFGIHPECFDQELNTYMQTDDNPFGFNDLHYVRSVAQSKQINAMNKPCIVISSSGMMNFGRVRHHMYNTIDDKRNTFLIVGYCSPDTTGGQLKSGATAVKIFGDWKTVRADVEVMDSFSAHGDQREMRDVLQNQKKSASHIFLVHGELDRQEIYKAYLEADGFKGIHIPELGEEVVL